jgi:hypothetical protein
MGVVGLMISAAALGFFLYRLRGHWGDMLRAFQEARYVYLIPAIAMLVVLYALRIARWRLFLKPIKPVRWLSATSATMIGFTANNVLPARLGEVIRPYLLERHEKVGFGRALATIGLARVFDLIGLALLLLFTWAILAASPRIKADLTEKPADGVSAGAEDSPSTLQAPQNRGKSKPQQQEALIRKVWKGGMIVAGMAVVGTCVLLGLALFPSPILRAGEACAKVLPEAWRAPLVGLMHSVVETMGFLKNWRGVGLGVAMSFGIWVSQGLSTWAIAEGLGLEIGAAGAFLAVLFVSAAVAVPQGPGFLGTFHLAATLAAEVFAAPTVEAGAFALLMWLVNIVPVTLAGFAFLAYEGLNLRRLTRESHEMEDEEKEQVEQAIEEGAGKNDVE